MRNIIVTIIKHTTIALLILTLSWFCIALVLLTHSSNQEVRYYPIEIHEPTLKNIVFVEDKYVIGTEKFLYLPSNYMLKVTKFKTGTKLGLTLNPPTQYEFILIKDIPNE